MKKILIFIVAYHAESHIVSVLNRIPPEIWNQEHYFTEILIIDDASTDKTIQLCKDYRRGKEKFNFTILHNAVNQGYGGNQKIGYLYAVKNNFDVVVLLHGDGQYAPENLPKMLEPILKGEADAVFGSRMLSKLDALKGGMPLYKFIGNRILTVIQNLFLGSNLSEFHSGYKGIQR